MSHFARPLRFAVFVSLVIASAAFADEQSIPAGVPQEGELTINSGPDGICNSTALGGDVQLTPAGSGTPNLGEIGCGPDGIVSSTAFADDVQLRPVGSFCGTPNVPVIDTGANGVADTSLAGDDIYLTGMVMGSAPANTACVGTGNDGMSSSTVAGDDVQLIANGAGNPNLAVILCGDDLIPSTVANNANPGGDDTQAIPVSLTATCATANDVVVRSGPVNSISDTRAEGPELVLKAVKPVKIVIRSGADSAAKALKLQVYNYEFGAVPSRSFLVNADDGNCPDGTLSLVDADDTTDGVQAVGDIELSRSAKVSMVATFTRSRVRTVSNRIPFRCEADITVVATETDPQEDDARIRRNNSTKITFEVFDYNDLP